MTDWSAYWWDSITGPRNLIEMVTDSIRKRKNVALMVPEDLPLRDEMRAAILQELRHSPELENVDVDYIDVKDECPGEKNVGSYLLNRYALHTVASNYRGRESLQKYLSQNNVLNNRVLWIKGMTEADEIQWIEFCKDYAISKDIEGHIVLETRFASKAEDENIDYIQYSDYINEYDVLLFNSVYLNKNSRQISQIWQQYIAALCATLCGTDAEISMELMGSTEFKSQEPEQRIMEIASMEEYARRGESSRHVLNEARENRKQDIENRIWKAQLKVLFPLLEMERVSFIDKYYDQIKEGLQTLYYDPNYKKGKRIHQFGNALDDPRDAEIGTIYRMMKLRRLDNDNHFLLFLPDESARIRVELLHELRNNLAHCTVCPVDKLVEFVQCFPYKWL